jgi:hypothetical protein
MQFVPHRIGEPRSHKRGVHRRLAIAKVAILRYDAPTSASAISTTWASVDALPFGRSLLDSLVASAIQNACEPVRVAGVREDANR